MSWESMTCFFLLNHRKICVHMKKHLKRLYVNVSVLELMREVWKCVTQGYSPVGDYCIQETVTRITHVKITHVHHPRSLRRREQQQLQLLGGLPGRRVLWRGRGGPKIRRGLRRRQLRGELGVKGQVQLLGRCQEGAGCRGIRAGVARFPGEEGRLEPLGGL